MEQNSVTNDPNDPKRKVQFLRIAAIGLALLALIGFVYIIVIHKENDNRFMRLLPVCFMPLMLSVIFNFIAAKKQKEIK